MSKRNGHAKAPAPKSLPAIPQGFKRLRLYPPVWRALPGDKIKGHPLSNEPFVRRDGHDANAVMFLVTEACPVLRYSARGEGVDDSDNGGKANPVANVGETVAVDVTHLGSVGRLMIYADQPDIAQTIELHAFDDGRGGIVYEAFIAVVPAQRADVDPRVKAQMANAMKAAGAAGARA